MSSLKNNLQSAQVNLLKSVPVKEDIVGTEINVKKVLKIMGLQKMLYLTSVELVQRICVV